MLLIEIDLETTLGFEKVKARKKKKQKLHEEKESDRELKFMEEIQQEMKRKRELIESLEKPANPDEIFGLQLNLGAFLNTKSVPLNMKYVMYYSSTK